ncbi:hypothetical protein NB703_004612 [Pantoea ananatis]|uniref:Uncharacterized protein n=1 Tax=Pantoea ananas TaxID=553 RepID=A0AAJ1D3E1_PANAN|nr:hypothetical protein [Pantoea ananatis]MCW0346519.1 hypothetical protein [Pantoea ananatis]
MKTKNMIFLLVSLYAMYVMVAWPNDLLPIREHLHIFLTGFFFFIGMFFSLDKVWKAIIWLFTDGKYKSK